MVAYLASPYTYVHENASFARQMRQIRFQMATIAAAALVADYRRHVFSPIVHCHPLAEVRDLPGDYEFWKDYNAAMLRMSCELLILDISGWKTSSGVQGELALAEQLHLPVRFVRINKKRTGQSAHTVTICEEPL